MRANAGCVVLLRICGSSAARRILRVNVRNANASLVNQTHTSGRHQQRGTPLDPFEADRALSVDWPAAFPNLAKHAHSIEQHGAIASMLPPRGGFRIQQRRA